MIFTKKEKELPEWSYQTQKNTISIQKQMFAKWFCKEFKIECYKDDKHKGYLYRCNSRNANITNDNFMQEIPLLVKETLIKHNFDKIKEYNVKQLVRSIRKQAKTVYDDKHNII